MKTYGEVDIYPRILDLGISWRWSASRPGRFTPGEIALSIHWIGGWVGPETNLDYTEGR
jgi:hypothetical protein